VQEALDGPLGPIEGGMLASELHMIRSRTLAGLEPPG
jgi:hypothetical protein